MGCTQQEAGHNKGFIGSGTAAKHAFVGTSLEGWDQCSRPAALCSPLMTHTLVVGHPAACCCDATCLPASRNWHTLCLHQASGPCSVSLPLLGMQITVSVKRGPGKDVYELKTEYKSKKEG